MLTPDTRNLITFENILKNSGNIPYGDKGHREDKDDLDDFGGQVLLQPGAAI